MRPSASTKCFIKQRSSYLKIHLANRHTKSIEIKHRYSQTQFRALAAGCRGAECDLGIKKIAFGTLRTANYAQILVLISQFIIISSYVLIV